MLVVLTCRGAGSEISIYAACCVATFLDCPYNQRLPTPHIAGREHAGNGRHVVFVGGDVAALIELDAELPKQSAANRTDESHRKQN